MPGNILENNKKNTKSVLICLLKSQAQLRESQKIQVFLPYGERAEETSSHGLYNCCETPPQIRDGIKNKIILNKNGHLGLPLVLLQFEKSSLLRWLCSKCILMQPASLCTVSCLFCYLPRTFYLRTNLKFVRHHWIRHTATEVVGNIREGRIAFKQRWAKHLSNWKREKEIAFGTQSGTPAGRPATKKRYSIKLKYFTYD